MHAGRRSEVCGNADRACVRLSFSDTSHVTVNNLRSPPHLISLPCLVLTRGTALRDGLLIKSRAR